MKRLAEADDGARNNDPPEPTVVPSDFPDLIAPLARRMAEIWIQACTPSPSSPQAQQRPDDPSGDLTAKELGKQIQMSQSTIYKHWRAGAWPNAYMISKRKGLRIPRRDVDAWKASKMPAKPAWGADARPTLRSIRRAS